MEEADLSMTVKKHMLQGFQKIADMSRIAALEMELNDVFHRRLPNKLQYDKRRDLIRIFNEIAKEIYGKGNECPVIEGFGSFTMDMFDAKSDLDLSINFHDMKVEARDVKIKTLQKFAKKFYILRSKKHVTNIQPIMSAKVPVLKVTDCGSGIECDFSVGNMDGIAKSQIIFMISSIDERFKKLCFLMKAWAKAHDINSSRDGTLNSLSLILMVAFHLQSREPPILPPFSALLTDGMNPQAVEENIPKFLNYGNGNKESLADLFVSLLVMLESAKALWPMGLCMSTYMGSWLYKTWKSKKGGNKIGMISIEDFTDRSQNTARVVTKKKKNKIYSCIHQSVHQIQSLADGIIYAGTLRNLLFGPDSLIETQGVQNIAPPSPQQPKLKPAEKKRKHAEERKKRSQLRKLAASSDVGTQSQVSVTQTSAGFGYEKSAEIRRCPTPNLHPLGSASASASARSDFVTKPLVSVGVGYDTGCNEIWRYPSPNFPLASASASASAKSQFGIRPHVSVGFGGYETSAEFRRYPTPNLHPLASASARARSDFVTQPQVSVGFGYETSCTEIRRYRTPNIHPLSSAPSPASARSDFLARSQVPVGFAYETSCTEIRRYPTPNLHPLASASAPASARSDFVARPQISVGFRYETSSCAEIQRHPTPNLHPLASASASAIAMPYCHPTPYPPPPPPVPYRRYLGFGNSYYSTPPLPPFHVSYARAFANGEYRRPL